jgi:hypothetical protein
MSYNDACFQSIQDCDDWLRDNPNSPTWLRQLVEATREWVTEILHLNKSEQFDEEFSPADICGCDACQDMLEALGITDA